MRSKEELDAYLNSWSEGDNITITADCLDMLESASKDLKILEILKKQINLGTCKRTYSEFGKIKKTEELRVINLSIFENEEDFKKVEEWLKK